MSANIPDDLLSAYHDRELTAAEEAVAKNWVDKSPDAKQEVNDYSRLSELLRELPREAAPPEFAAAVMRQAERETLIPLPDSAPAVRPKSRFFGLTGRQLVVAGAIGATAVAAGIAVMVLPGKPPSTPSVASRDLRRSDRLELANAPARRAELERRVVRDELKAPAPTGVFTGSEVRSKSFAAPSSVAAKAPASSDFNLAFPANLKTAKVGDVIEALESDGDQVAVVRLTVVDQAAGLDGIQNVFIRNASRTVQNKDEIAQLKERFNWSQNGIAQKMMRPADQPEAGKPGELMCVYVKGTREELQRVLEGVQRESHIQEAQLTNTISVSQLEHYANRSVSADNRKRDQAGSGPDTAQRVDLLNLPASAIEKIVAEKETAPRLSKEQRPHPGLLGANDVDKKIPADGKTELRTFESGQRSSRQSVQGQTVQAKERFDRSGKATTQAAPAPHRVGAGQSQGAIDGRLARSAKSAPITSQRAYSAFFFVIDDKGQAPAQQSPPAAAPVPSASSAPAAPAKAAPAKAAR